MAHFTSTGMETINDEVKTLVAQNSAVAGGQASLSGMATLFTAATGLGATAGAIASTAIPGAGFLVKGLSATLGAGAGGKLAWKGWSWIRDNVLDQHGCYIQYLNRNGQAMDAGLNQSGQGMVVGRYHTKKLLPGILGVSNKVRTPEGYSYIRTNDLLKSLGWKEKEITDLVRYISFENALVNSQVLKYSGVGPEKAGLNRFFKVICKVTNIVDGDTIDVVDVFDTEQKSFRIRFDGINTPELNIIKTDISSSGLSARLSKVKIQNNIATFYTEQDHHFKTDNVVVINNSIGFNTTAKIENVDFVSVSGTNYHTFDIVSPLPDAPIASVSGTATVYSTSSGSLINPKSPGGKATNFTKNAIADKLIILRISPNSNKVSASLVNDDFEAGSQVYNNPSYYQLDIFGGETYDTNDRVIGTIFYNTPQDILEKIIIEANSLFDKNSKSSNATLLTSLSNSFYIETFKTRYTTIANAINDQKLINYTSQSNSSSITSMSTAKKEIYNRYVTVRCLQFIYDKVSEWPNIEWDEYYDDGTPVSLNWELVVNNLANVYTKGLLYEQPSVITAMENIPGSAI
jgi:hypothetical protein